MIVFTYALSMFIVGIASVEVSGFFPSHARASALRYGIGNILVVALGFMVLALVIATLWLGVSQLSWPSMVIASGLAMLSAPLAFQLIPNRFWDSRTGVGITVLLTASMLAMLFHNYMQ